MIYLSIICFIIEWENCYGNGYQKRHDWNAQITMKMIEVTCAIIEHNNRVLVTQRSEKMSLPLKWEFPGGKIEKDETAEACLIREILEELHINVKITKRLNSNTHQYSETKIIKLIPFICELTDGEVKLTEHANFLWLCKSELTKLDWAAADIPVLNEYLNTI